MDTVPLPTNIIRIDSRYRRQALDVARGEVAQVQVEEEEESSHRVVTEPLLVRERKGRAVMGKPHRLFHRRQAQAPPAVLTVNVEVVATLDTAGSVIALHTATPQAVATEVTAVAIAAAASVPSAAVPSVPSVPPFPSDLNVPSVPAYPWPSGVPSVEAMRTSAPSASSAPPASTPGPTRSSVAAFPSMSGLNSTTSTTTSSTPSSSLNTTSSTSSSSSASSSTSSSTSSSFSSTQSSVTSTPTSSAQTTSVYWIASTTAGGENGGGGGFVAPEGTGASATPSTAPATDTDSSSPLQTPGVVGAVIGSLAGFALLLAFILFLVRRHKQKQNGGALQLTGDDATDNQSMTHTEARSSFLPPSFLNRFSGASRSTADSSGTGERSFQRISGRKLPSAFSEGMTSEQFAAGRGEGTLSGSSFYHDEKGFYGGPGVVSKDFGDRSGFAKEVGEMSNTGTMGTEERVRPSPARTPVIHHADDAPDWGTLSPPLTPNVDIPRGSLGRSHVSRDGSRSSRFTENV